MSKSLLEAFSNASINTNFNLKISRKDVVSYEPLTNDALFHIPLIAVSILVLVKSSKRNVSTGEIGRLVGILFEETLAGFKGSSQLLSWSSTLRHRVADGIVFLEQISFLEVSEERKLNILENGNKFILQLRKEQTELGQATRGFFRNSDECFERLERLV